MLEAERRLRRKALRDKIKAVAQRHMVEMRAEGFRIVYDSTGWEVSFRRNWNKKGKNK